jgi:hypothetical protein
MRPSSLLACLLLVPSGRADEPAVAFERKEGRLVIRIGDRPFAEYVHDDATIKRPYFCNVHTPGGVQVTRNHPPVKGKDATDHDTMHPGIWLAFGDISGHDCWRNKARVRHEKFVEAPRDGKGRGSFTALNSYLSTDGKSVIARETCRITIRVAEEGYRVSWDSTFEKGDVPCVFGDQEEMGLGVRLATPLTVKAGGRILNSDGKKNEREVWGKTADWCDYGGIIDRMTCGMMLMPDPANFRKSWFHSRDYGVLVANSFGQNAFTRGPKGKVEVSDSPLRLRFGILIYAAASDIDRAKVYKDYLQSLKGAPR